MELADTPLMDLVPQLSPEFERPTHLWEWCDLIEEAAQAKPVRALCAMPIRHWKTEVTCHGVIRILLKDPTTPIIYFTHSFERSQQVGKRIRELARQTKVGPTRGQDTIVDWKNEHGGGVVIMSAEQSRLGYNCGCLIADDPIDEHGAQDPKVREAVDHALLHYGARCMRKGQPGPILILMSRWHPDDPIGRRLQRRAVEWKYVHQSAVLDEGTPDERAFAPHVWDLPALKAMRAELAEKDPTERLWWAQLMGEPRPMGADLFGPATYYTTLPEYGYRKAAGVDMAFTVGEGSDWFARCIGRVYGQKMYLLDVTRHRIDAHHIESTLRSDMNKYGRHNFFSYMSGPEVGLAKVLIERGITIARMKARYSKLVRAQRTVKRWNDGNVLVPSDGLWVPGFLHRVSCFRGNDKDSDDDEVDALVSMCDGVMGGMVAGGPTTIGKAFGGFM